MIVHSKYSLIQKAYAAQTVKNKVLIHSEYTETQCTHRGSECKKALCTQRLSTHRDNFHTDSEAGSGSVFAEVLARVV